MYIKVELFIRYTVYDLYSIRIQYTIDSILFIQYGSSKDFFLEATLKKRLRLTGTKKIKTY